MNKKEFYEEFKKLCMYFKDKTYENKRVTALYYAEVKSMSLEQFISKCDELITTCRFMPRIAEMNIKSDIGHRGRAYTKEFLNQFYDN